MAREDRYKIRRRATVGAVAAEEDSTFLETCFVDTGDLERLRDTTNPHRIVLGRTGSGKTALLQQLLQEEHAIAIDPASLSLQYIANNQILQFLDQQGVKLDLFYRLLWRHILAVELIKAKYNISSPDSALSNFWSSVCRLIARDKKKQLATDYLRQWGDSIWEDTEHRVKEVVETFEEKLTTEIGFLAKYFKLGGENASRMTREEKAEVVHRGTTIVNSIQIKRLSDLIGVLAEDIFDDPQQRFYLVIDRLDEGWVDETLRHKLIRALIETVRDFQKVQNCKIVVALRQDLLERVFRLTRDAGFQEEKYESLYLRLTWDKAGLVELLDRRVNRLFRPQYTTAELTHTDLLPRKIGREPVTDFILRATLYRPRDMIMFFNSCLEHGVNHTRLTVRQVRAAEADYSRGRFRSLGDEWVTEYPNLLNFALTFLRTTSKSFMLDSIDQKTAENAFLNLGYDEKVEEDELVLITRSVVEGDKPYSEAFNQIMGIFYKVGLVGIKVAPYEGVAWSFRGHPGVSGAEIGANMKIHICPAFYRVLGTTQRA